MLNRTNAELQFQAHMQVHQMTSHPTRQRPAFPTSYGSETDRLPGSSEHLHLPSEPIWFGREMASDGFSDPMHLPSSQPSDDTPLRSSLFTRCPHPPTLPLPLNYYPLDSGATSAALVLTPPTTPPAPHSSTVHLSGSEFELPTAHTHTHGTSPTMASARRSSCAITRGSWGACGDV